MALKIDSTNSVYDFGLFSFNAATSPLTVAADGVVMSQQNAGTVNGIFAFTVPAAITVLGIVGSKFDNAIEIASSAGTAKISIGDSGQVSGEIHGINSAATSTIDNKGSIHGKTGDGIHLLAGGKNTITNSGLIYGGDNGIDVVGGIPGASYTVKNSGIIQNGYDGANDITVAETLTNSGSITGGVVMYAGADKFTNSGTVNGGVDMGSGNDTFTNTGNVTGGISLGTGNDSFKGGNDQEAIEDEGGQDIYNFGGGNDIFDVGSAVSDGLTDTIDGGANDKGGGDLYDASDEVDQVIVNLDTKSHTNFMAGTNTVRDANTATGTIIGTDKVKNFENVNTGSGSDIVFGNSASNVIDTDAGNDRLYGFDGDDTLRGDAGADYYFGGKGKDSLISTADGDEDRFFYQSKTDSTLALKGRDTIINFEDGLDLIDLSLMSLGDLDFAGVDTDFTPGSGAEARVISLPDKYVVEIDLDGNGKADMAIDVNSTAPMAWSIADFDW